MFGNINPFAPFANKGNAPKAARDQSFPPKKQNPPRTYAVGPVLDQNDIKYIFHILLNHKIHPVKGSENVEYSPDPELPFFTFFGHCNLEEEIPYNIIFNGEPLYISPVDTEYLVEQVDFNRNLIIHPNILDLSYLNQRGFNVLTELEEEPEKLSNSIRFLLFLSALKCYKYSYFDEDTRFLTITHLRFAGNGLKSTKDFLNIKGIFRNLEHVSFYDNPLPQKEFSQNRFRNSGFQPYFYREFDLSIFQKTPPKKPVEKVVKREPEANKQVPHWRIHIPSVQSNVVIAKYLQIPFDTFAINFMNSNADNIGTFYDIETCKISFTIDTCGPKSPLAMLAMYSSTSDHPKILSGQKAVMFIISLYKLFPSKVYSRFHCSELLPGMYALVFHGVFQHVSGYYFGFDRTLTITENNKLEQKYGITNDNLFLHIQYE